MAKHSPKWESMHDFPLTECMEQAILNDVSLTKNNFIFILMEFQEADSSALTLTANAWRVLIAADGTRQVCKIDI